MVAKSITANKINKQIHDTKLISFRSRHLKFVCTVNLNPKEQSTRHHVSRDREPSRIHTKKICRLLTKCRKLRKAARKDMKKNVPASSCIHRYTQSSSYEYQRVMCNSYFDHHIKMRLNYQKSNSVTSSRVLKSNCKLDKKKQSSNSLKQLEHLSKTKNSVHKNSNHAHRINCCKLHLSGDIEVNPGPTFNNPTGTIHAPYSQGNVDIFGENAGRQCVPMSLCCLIFVYREKSVCDTNDLVNIMNFGNQLYSALSRLLKQRYLLLEELPTLITVDNIDYTLHLSQSYTGNLHEAVVNDNVPFVIPLGSALERLQQETFTSFLLTIECNTVSIFIDSNNGLLKVFDSHARDSFGMPHPHGTCVLLEFDSIQNLSEYFKHLYRLGAIFEVKGVKVSNVCDSDIFENVVTDDCNFVDTTNNCDANEICSSETIRNETMNGDCDYNVAQTCYAFLYAICFSTIKACNYWNNETQNAITEHAIRLFDEVFHKNSLSVTYLPRRTGICGTPFQITYTSRHEGLLSCTSVSSKDALAVVISANTVNNTGFLISCQGQSLACIIQRKICDKKSQRTKYFLLASNENCELYLSQKLCDSRSVVDKLCGYLSSDLSDHKETEYILQFLSTSCSLTKSEKLRVLRKHKSNVQRELMRKHKKMQNEAMSPTEKKILNAVKYQKMDPIRKQAVLNNKRLKYERMDPTKKQVFLESLHSKYRYSDMDHAKKKILLENMALRYKSMDALDKEAYRKRSRENRKRNYDEAKSEQKGKKQHALNYYISNFHKRIKEGPYYICTVCNRLLYRKSVQLLGRNNYTSVPQSVFTNVISYDNKEYICITCHSKVLKGKIPCQAVHNDMSVDEIPQELALLEKLEQILVAQRIVFEKIIVMPKGQQKKVSGAICNVPVNCAETCKVLPRPPERSGIIMLKLKRKLQFRGHVYFQAVRPQQVENALNWLMQNNPLYDNVTIDMTNISENLKTLQHDNSTDTSTSCHEIKNDVMEENEDPLHAHRQGTNETCLQSVVPDYPVTVQQSGSLGNEIYDIAPGENKHPTSIMTDKKCEQLAFPVLFPKGRFGYTDERQIKLSPVKYFNARLLHYTGRFATNSEYLFFAQFVLEQKKVADSINIALRKIQGQPVTASQIKSDVNKLKSMVCQDQAYLFLRQIPGTPPYWQKFMYEVIAMVKQLGIPTWFMTLSCADLRWPELFQIVARTQGRDISEEEVEALSYVERCQMLNANPVVTAKHFQHRVETFFSEVLLSESNPIGKITYYALRIEFQMRGSPHLHALIWTSDCPKLASETKNAYVKFIDEHVQANLPNEPDDPELHELVNTYQKHNHSKTCRKYKNTPCRFNFGQFFTKETVIAEPLDENIDEETKYNILNRRKEILTNVKQKIDEVLNPSKENYDATATETDVLESVGFTEDEYYWALSISADSDFDLHLKRPANSCFINNYFVAGIKGFAANVDLQPVFNHYKCITYVCSYFTKDETECSQAIANAAKEAKLSNMNVRDGLKKIGAAFLSTREVSSQECVYRCMPELWLRKIFPKTVFVSTDLPEKRIRIAKSQNDLDELDDDCTDIYKSNIIERYSLRPNGIPSVDKLCLAKFAAFYYRDYKTDVADTKDSQPEVLNDELLHSKHSNINTEENCLPPKIKLMNRNEYMKCRKVKAVLRYHTPSKRKEPELYFHHLVMMYLPWREETELFGPDQTYVSKFYESGVQTIIEHNRAIFEPDADAITEALESMTNNPRENIHSYDSINDQENADLHDELPNDQNPNESFNNQEPSHLDPTQSSQSSSGIISYHNQPSEITDDELRESVRCLNKQQRCAYDIVLSWCRKLIKNMNSLKPIEVEPIYLFVTGGGGAGKSHLIKTMYHTAVKTFRHPPCSPELPSVLLMAPTGVAAINIEGTTINTGLAIPKEAGDYLPAMSDQKKTQYRLSLKDLKLIIIDEISMVGNTTLLHVHQRLKEIFGCSFDNLFAGKSIIAVGDLYQLPPIKKKAVFDSYRVEAHNVCHPWNVFKIIELTEIMRQKNDKAFTELLNRVRTASHTEDDIKVIQSRCISPSDSNYPTDALHIWAENSPVNEHNQIKLKTIEAPLFILKAKDQYPKNVNRQDVERVLARGRSETCGLDFEIQIKKGARIMLTTNINIQDRLINGQMGTVIKIDVNVNNEPILLYIKFDDEKAGKTTINTSSNIFARENHVVPIEPVLAKIKIRPGKASSPEVQRIQFPIALSWACTVHKVQGLTLENVVVSLELKKQKSFNYGQIYVALSRATSLQGLHILGKIEGKHIKANPKVNEEYERLRHSSSIFKTPANTDLSNKSTLTVSLLNVRSLRKHCKDIKHHCQLFNSDILALTETQLLPGESDMGIKEHLIPFRIYRQDHCTDKFSSMAICVKSHLEVKDHEYISSLNAVKFNLIDTNVQKYICFLLLYRKNNSNFSQYMNALEYAINSSRIDVVLGDFNVNYFNETHSQPLISLMESLNYSQIVTEPTFVSSGSLLDHVYVNSTSRQVVNNSVVSVYYSDHDAVVTSLQYSA